MWIKEIPDLINKIKKLRIIYPEFFYLLILGMKSLFKGLRPLFKETVSLAFRVFLQLPAWH